MCIVDSPHHYRGRVLWFERQVVDRLVSTPDPRRRADITAYVDGTITAMPEHLRAAIGAASLAFGGWFSVVRPRANSVSATTSDPLVHALDTSWIPPMRQYVRLFRSLVLFAEQELP
ncbi:MAG: hypothetical protein QOG30_2065 [Acidimicrobiaceae bacterium]